ncbi:hypothetical protein E4T66_17630 [Sinimarinibacterium sp. CAU 1509]|uniref:hypothetical protein n=1 Tax=Sinimarinibacterium sp. CAU 1509 TaxID=2562283 RepID=UPI0010ABB952|nr:hypothetical protein [Sinimarinibacterium sp. CAU 1509]TJY57229.1 hypothetical protein E4T66_17630 [Sinimarinibacterium sp. CAU 1509]
MRTLLILLTLAAVTGCSELQAVTQRVDLSALTFAPSEPQHSIAADLAIQEARKRLLEPSRSGHADLDALRLVTPYLGTSVEAAEFVLASGLTDRPAPSADEARTMRQLRERALRTAISSGRLYHLPKYWAGLSEQPALDLTIYDLAFAVPATAYVAEESYDSKIGAWAQLQLTRYWLDGCPTSRLARGALQLDDGACKPRTEVALHFAKLYVANASIPLEDRNAAADAVADRIAILEALHPTPEAK